MDAGLRVGMVGVLISLFSLAAYYLWQEKKWIGWASLCIFIALAGVWGWMEFKPYIIGFYKNSPFLSSVLVFIVSGVLATSVWLWGLSKQTIVVPQAPTPVPELDYAPFRNVYPSYENRLGKPLGLVKILKHVSYDNYEKATVAWIQHPSITTGHFIIVRQPDQKWVFQATDRVPEDLKYYDIHLRKKEFPNCPKGLQPPVGEIMQLWKEDPKYWKDLLSWREKGCYILDQVRYLKFERGYMVGPLPTYRYGGPPTLPNHPNAYILVLSEDGKKWDSPSTDAPAPQCESYGSQGDDNGHPKQRP